MTLREIAMRALPRFRSFVVACCWCVFLPTATQAASRTLKAGQVLGIGEHIVLSGDDVREVQGPRERPCRIDANGQQIKTADNWRGRINVRYCGFRGLGSARVPCLDVTATAKGDRIVIEH